MKTFKKKKKTFKKKKKFQIRKKGFQVVKTNSENLLKKRSCITEKR